MESHYQILGVSENADQVAIKGAFKKQAIKHHPDKNPEDPSAEEAFKAINEAYQILSNPYEKARYDLKLKYGTFTYETVVTEHSPDDVGFDGDKEYARSKRKYKGAPIDYKENWTATIYAFGFTLVVAVIIMTGVWIHDYIERKELEELITSRRTQYNEALKMEANGNLDGALAVLFDFGSFYDSEMDIQAHRKDLLESITFNGQKAFNIKEYNNAIFYFEILEKYSATRASSIRESLAISYKESRRPHKSIKILTELLTIGYRHIETYLQLAEIYRDQLDDIPMAQNYYELASKIAINYYRSVYGEAFAVVIHEKYLPPIHFDLYTGLADIYLQSEEYEKAFKASKWNIQTWPDSAVNYHIMAKSLEVKGSTSEACDMYYVAYSLDDNLRVPTSCQ